MNPVLRKYRRFRQIQVHQGFPQALRATRASLANSAEYRWLRVREGVFGRPLLAESTQSLVPDNDRYDIVSFLPSEGADPVTPRPDSVAVVIPVYRNAEVTRRCLESVLSADAVSLGEVIVVDDASPEPELSAYLDALAAGGRIRLLRNHVNLGFVASVNRGMAEAGERDVVLLNSDTVVAGDWVDRLAAHAPAGHKVGTVTPFSNNATICSYPTLDGIDGLPLDETVDSMDAAFAAANAGRATPIPTAVGFCMYISRPCLEDVGLFDEQAFKKGYGEENDFCLRAARRGWRHLLAADTFVWHQGEVSFGAAAKDLQAGALQELRRRYPGYLGGVARHVEFDAARPWRIAATAARFRQGPRPVILMVTHALGYGTEKHVVDLCLHYRRDARFLILQPTPEGPVRLWCPDTAEGLDLRWRLPTGVESLAALLRSFGVARVHVHHTLGLSLDMRELLRRLGKPFDLTVHDFYTVCPRVRLSLPQAAYCGGPEDARCAQCLSLPPRAEVLQISSWRDAKGWMLAEAERVICPSRDAAGHVASQVVGPQLIVAPHDTLAHEEFPAPAPPTLMAGEPLRVAILGVLSKDKGARVVVESLRALRTTPLRVDMTLIGWVDEDARRPIRGTGLATTGPYRPEELSWYLGRGTAARRLVPGGVARDILLYAQRGDACGPSCARSRSRGVQ